MRGLAGSPIRLLDPSDDGDTVATALADAACPVLDGTLPDHWARAFRNTAWPPRRTLFAAAITTRSAYHRAVVPSVITWAVRHGVLPAEERIAAETALCEALANAIVHGNLELPSLGTFGGDLGVYHRAIGERLADDTFGLRPIGLLWRRSRSLLFLHVDDAGQGYRKRPPPEPGTDAPVSGRGWTLMTALVPHVRASRGGRRLTLGFTDV